MKIDLLDIDDFISSHVCGEVKDSINFNSDNTPTDEGLFSFTLFGQAGSDARRNNWGYINLNKHFLHPVMYKMLKEMDRKIEKCIMNQGKFIINSKGLLEESEEGESGITFIYDNFDNIVFRETGSRRRTERQVMLKKMGRDKIFIDKWLVIPCFYRDYKVPTKENTRVEAVDEINDLYGKLLRLASNISDDEIFAFSGVNTEAQIQNILNDIYKMLTSGLAKKTGLIHQGLLGKSIDYATRSVISAPRHNVQRWDEDPIRFGYTGIPLSQLCVLFFPFFVKYIQDMIEPYKEELEQKNVNVDEEFSEEKIVKIINLFFKAPDMRFKEFKVHDVKGNEVSVDMFTEDLGRPFSITDLLYIAAVDVTADKHVYLTRYPIEQYRAKRFLISTNSCMK